MVLYISPAELNIRSRGVYTGYLLNSLIEIIDFCNEKLGETILVGKKECIIEVDVIVWLTSGLLQKVVK